MAEHGGDLVAAWAAHIHEVAVWRLNETLQLVLLLLHLWVWVQEILHGLQKVRRTSSKRNRQVSIGKACKHTSNKLIMLYAGFEIAA